MDLIKIIRENKLIYLKLDSLTKELMKTTGESQNDLKLQINSLINEGTLYLDEQNKISISADKGYFKAKITLNRKGYGFAKVEGYPDFFVPAFAINGAYDGDKLAGMAQLYVSQEMLADFKKELDEAVMERYNQILEYQKQALSQKNKNAR